MVILTTLIFAFGFSAAGYLVFINSLRLLKDWHQEMRLMITK